MKKNAHGFWSERPRPGQQDARLLAAERLHALRQLSYDQLRSRAGQEPEVEEVVGLSGERLRRLTSVKRVSRREGEELNVRIQVDNGSRLGRVRPLAEHLVVATPDGEMAGNYTISSEGNDPRRYRLPGES